MTTKFKAVTTDGKWAESDGQTIITFNYRCFFLRWSFGPDVWYLRETDYIEVIPETVCVGVEYGGKWYYSGDQFSISPRYMSTLEFKDGCMFSVYKHPEDGEEIPLFDMGSISMKMAQYIGNIHDHLIR